jgi:cell division protein FtsI (penicillin-binding protein 3)
VTPPGPSRPPPRTGRPGPSSRSRPSAPRRGGPAPAPPARRHPAARPTLGSAPARRPPRRRRARPGRPHLRVVAMLVVLLVGFSAIGVRLVQVQALEGEAYVAYGASQRFQTIALPAERGSIFDRNGHDLAVSLPQRTIWANPLLIERPDEVAGALAVPLALDAEASVALTDRLGSDAGFVYVARRVDDSVADAVEELQLPGVFLLDEPKRFTPAGDLARSLLGQVGVDNEGLWPASRCQYDELLTGDARRAGHREGPRGSHHPGRGAPAAARGARRRPGADHRPVHAVRDRAGAGRPDRGQGSQGRDRHRDPPGHRRDPGAGQRGHVDPETGEVRATPGTTWRSRPSTSPGSVNKVITLAAALEEGLVSPETRHSRSPTRCRWRSPFTDHDPHPTEDWSVTGSSPSRPTSAPSRSPRCWARTGSTLPAQLRLREPTALGFPNEAAGILLAPERWSAAPRSARSRSGRASR